MAGGDRARGFDENISLFALLPDASREELIVEAAIMAREVLAAQQADTPAITGRLRRSESLKAFTNKFGFVSGLLNVRDAGKVNGRTTGAVAGGEYYGRFVALGRSAQTVTVTRRIKRRRLKGNNKNGNARQAVFGGATTRLRRRSSPNAGTPIGSPYKLRVRARAGHDFIRQPILEQVADRSLSEIWSKTLTRLEGAT